MSCEQRFLVDEYLDRELSEPEREAFEAHLAGCAACRGELEEIRALVAAAGALPASVEPPRDLWPETAARLEAPRRSRPGWLLGGGGLAAATLLAALCTGVLGAWLLWPSGPDLGPARAALAEGDLPGAYAAWAALSEDHASDAEVAEGAAYTALLAGDYAEAERLLAALEDGPEVRLRRALVALRAGDLDHVRDHGEASGLPSGLVLAAEVRLADGEVDHAQALLTRASGAGGAAGGTARDYLALLGSPSPEERGLAEATALWAVGERVPSCLVAEELVVELPDGDDRDDLLVLWASRCVTSREPGPAERLLDQVVVAPPGQQWRIHALRAMVHAARGEREAALATFGRLEAGGAPAQGLADARATAASLTDDRDFAVALVGDQRSVAAARVLLEVGAVEEARRAAPDGTALASVLGGR